MMPFSVLDLAPIIDGSDAAGAFRNTIDLAQHAERWGEEGSASAPETGA